MIDPLMLSDAPAAAALSAGFGWPHRLEDWTWFLSLGQGVAWREGGALLGTALMIPIDAAHGTIGLVQVSPALQGRGIGRQLMAAVMALGGSRSLMLHATEAGAGLYARMGFVPGGVVEQWQGVVGAGAGPQAGHAIRRGGAADFEAVCALDRAATGLDRVALLRSVLASSTVALEGPPGGLRGYAMRRRFGRGALLGPIVAESPAQAAALVAELQVPGFMRLDVPAGCGVIEAIGAPSLASVGDVRRMVRGTWPAPGGPAVFGLVTQATG